MYRRLLIAVALGLGLAAGAASAQSSADKAAVDAAKAQGLVGEQGDGLLGFVSGSVDAQVRGAVAAINAGRTEAYQQIATKTGVTEEAAAEATAQQLIGRLPSGYYYKLLGGEWMRK